jgi:hypothetical protein
LDFEWAFNTCLWLFLWQINEFYRELLVRLLDKPGSNKGEIIVFSIGIHCLPRIIYMPIKWILYGVAGELNKHKKIK